MKTASQILRFDRPNFAYQAPTITNEVNTFTGKGYTQHK